MKKFMEGDWICNTCGNHNYSGRVVCNRCDEEVREGMKRGDWICRSCKNHNFAKRTTCGNVICGATRQDGDEKTMGGAGGTSKWAKAAAAAREEGAAIAASVHNVAALMNWNQPRDAFGDTEWRPQEFKKGDWECPSCGNHNFASRMNCKKCNTVREKFEEADSLERQWSTYKLKQGPPERLWGNP